MKSFVTSLLAILTLSLGLASCQDEFRRSGQSEQSLGKNSPIAQRIMSLTGNNTSRDNTIDSTDCFSVKLPVEVIVNGNSITVASEADYEIVDEILQGTPTGGTVDFVYPITLVTPGFEEVLVGSDEEFNDALEGCVGFQAVDCLDFSYPVRISTYDTGSQTPATVTIDNAQEFYFTIANLQDDAVFEIQYPISATNNSNQLVSIDSNGELEDAMAAAIADCDCANENILTDGLIVYMPFANEVADLTGFSEPAAIGASSFATDRSDNPSAALSFDNAETGTQVILQGNANNNMLQNDEFTVSIWFNRQNDSGVVPMQEILFATSQMTLFVMNDDQQAFHPRLSVPGNELVDQVWLDQQLGPQLGVWHHMAIVYENNFISVYRDGQLVAEANNVFFDGNVLLPNFIGGNFEGLIDDVRVYNRALNFDEILVLASLEGDTNTCLD